MSLAIGLECCLESPLPVLRSGRFGLLMNQASIDRRCRPACDVLAEAFPGRLQALFSPQHGLWGQEQANMVESPHERHPVLGVPVYSLYSETRRPLAHMLAGLDALVVDLADVGTRVYTFAWTVAGCLEAAAEANVAVVVLDRPNPLGGEIVEGPPLEPGLESFVGRAGFPMRHGLTLGELARVINGRIDPPAELDVVPCRGWQRSMLFPETGLLWVPPSPNLPAFSSALAYPGMVLLEGTNLSEGRGTTTPFELVGAPFIEPFRLAAELAAFELRGVAFRPARFRPTFDKWAGQSCGGVALMVTDPHEFRPYRTALCLMAALRNTWPDDFAWSEPPYEYETKRMPIDLLAGSSALRETFSCGRPVTGDDIDALSFVDEDADPNAF
ncbi:MAG: DUF1343 domain-containing protein [Planctomycetes bacterium]|nr:DUF1343 domain-containing protein [Planctomycetota bacterium]